MNDIARISKRAVDYLFDRPAKNEDPSPIWCLGQCYDSKYEATTGVPATGTSPSSKSDSGVSHADSAVVTESLKKPEEQEQAGDEDLVKSFDHVQVSKSMVEEDFGWPTDFLDDFQSRIWLTYRSGFPLIAKSNDPAAAAAMSFSTRLRNLTNQAGFTSDTGWGCMIRSGQSLLANTILTLKLGRTWRKGERDEEHKDILSLFADGPEAPFSIHKFVEHGARACGTYPGEWFGPSATARCIRALTEKYHEAGLQVYAKPNDSDVYIDSLMSVATLKDADDRFQPTLILLGIRIGIDEVTPAYHAALKAVLELPQSVGIAGGRPSSSHYFVGHQGDQFFYLDPHFTRPMLSPQPSGEDIESCHTRRIRRLSITEMDPSMLLGFLIHSKEEFDEWRRAVTEVPGKAIIHVHDSEPKYTTGLDRPGAVDEVETLDETLDEDDG